MGVHNHPQHPISERLDPRQAVLQLLVGHVLLGPFGSRERLLHPFESNPALLQSVTRMFGQMILHPISLFPFHSALSITTRYSMSR